MATIVAAAGGGNWTAGGTWVGGIVPTAADDVQLANTSGNVTINGAAFCRSIDCTGYTGTLTHNAAITLNIGDGTAGAGNVALKFVAGMTYTLGNVGTSALAFVSTSATQQTIDFAGKSVASVTFNGTGGSWILQSALISTQNSTVAVTLSAGSLNTNSQGITTGRFVVAGTTTRSLTLGASAINLNTNSGGNGVWDATTITNFTFNADTSTITATASNSTFTGGGLTFYDVALITGPGGTYSISGANTFNSLHITCATNGRYSVTADQVVNGALTIQGSSNTSMGFLLSNTRGTQRTITAASATIIDMNFMDMAAVGAAAPWNAINCGDMGSNSNITFPAPVTRYWVDANGGAWNTTASWSTSSGGASGASIPLAQDTVVFDANSITVGGSTITVNVQCVPSIDFSNIQNSPNVSFSITNGLVYVAGNLILHPSMGSTGTTLLLMNGRGSQIFNGAGVAMANSIQFEPFGGSYTLQGNLVTTGSLTFSNGIVDANGYNVTTSSLLSTGAASVTRTLVMGSGTWTLTGTGTIADLRSPTGFTITPGTSTIVISDTSATAKTFSSAAFTFNNLTIPSGGSGVVSIVGTGAKTFNNMTIGAPKSVSFLNGSGNTVTLTGQFAATGSPGNLVTLTSSSTGSQFFLSKASGTVSCDYLSLRDSNAGGGATWYAGANSTNVGNNTGWLFAAGPGGSNLMMMGIG